MLNLKLDTEDLQVLIAFNPISVNCKKNYSIEFPNHPRTLHKQLVSKYRCSYETSVFLMHLKEYNDASRAKILDDISDMPLEQSTFKRNQLPLWILHNDIAANIVIEKIKNHISPNYKTVTLLYNKSSLSTRKVKFLSKLCRSNKWNFVEHSKMIGSESSVVIHYETDAIDPEAYSRSQNLLIIVTR